MFARFIKLFLAPVILFLGGFAIIGGVMDTLEVGEGDQLSAAVSAYLIILMGVVPAVLVALATEESVRKRALILMGGSLAKVVTIGILVLVFRRAMLPFADKNSFLIWLFLSYLVVSPLGWFVVAAKALPGEESGQA